MGLIAPSSNPSDLGGTVVETQSTYYLFYYFTYKCDVSIFPVSAPLDPMDLVAAFLHS